MRSLAETVSCQISLTPIESANYAADVERALSVISESGLDHEVGPFSTVVRGEKVKVFGLVRDIFDRLEKTCGFTLEVKFSNVCGCRAMKL